ncbi:enoyl-CoA hydratase [Pacificimonas sp. WHA3]|uniref:Enoyl-CoA hydratase n=1 Tax=Pacificimonas pallii TaxID=2827236 RepID=A0ABS6SAC2_9SPHN|nr:enoyl-CoA hydratase [Pacificimonas pallii]MBV7255322.1 enoyl-CoA hydratase [Pacificimonas pallii]
MREDDVLYALPAPHIALITLKRVEVRNAQDTQMLYAVHDAFKRAAGDDNIKVIILAANGAHFSAGNDLREVDEIQNLAAHDTIGMWSDFAAPGQEGMMAREREVYFGIAEAIRSVPKPTIAAVQGRCISGGLMLVWPCDIIVAADDASFIDNTLVLGIPGVEWFAHPFELGPRKAKEMLFGAEAVSAQDAAQLGMVNHVVPAKELREFAIALATRFAKQSSFALKLAKEAVNSFQDSQGREAAMKSAFLAHQLGHSHSKEVFGLPIDPRNLDAKLLKGTKYER